MNNENWARQWLKANDLFLIPVVIGTKTPKKEAAGWVDKETSFDINPDEIGNSINAMISLGKSGIAVLDIDVKSDPNLIDKLAKHFSIIDYNSYEEAISYMFKGSLVIKTPSNGYHVYFSDKGLKNLGINKSLIKIDMGGTKLDIDWLTGDNRTIMCPLSVITTQQNEKLSYKVLGVADGNGKYNLDKIITTLELPEPPLTLVSIISLALKYAEDKHFAKKELNSISLLNDLKYYLKDKPVLLNKIGWLGCRNIYLHLSNLPSYKLTTQILSHVQKQLLFLNKLGAFNSGKSISNVWLKRLFKLLTNKDWIDDSNSLSDNNSNLSDNSSPYSFDLLEKLIQYASAINLDNQSIDKFLEIPEKKNLNELFKQKISEISKQIKDEKTKNNLLPVLLILLLPGLNGDIDKNLIKNDNTYNFFIHLSRYFLLDGLCYLLYERFSPSKPAYVAVWLFSLKFAKALTILSPVEKVTLEISDIALNTWLYLNILHLICWKYDEPGHQYFYNYQLNYTINTIYSNTSPLECLSDLRKMPNGVPPIDLVNIAKAIDDILNTYSTRKDISHVSFAKHRITEFLIKYHELFPKELIYPLKLYIGKEKFEKQEPIENNKDKLNNHDDLSVSLF